ncbi:hypothetical protein Pmar_PMAR016881 [Perkinsus marinus ATCC 50983]|uniref:Uncharacterized protein n=1 Tax=Perkinsus marinus (strain ATCC 50983 / TXsc) TaxID=423536 RepID=C5LX96_PERM5|nr:hypothetical protein Pmar_PMAR016881 [Perkinsus marinus ATCC 50983]EEQ98645.1 hypothetical protein Pmar_PMAR016881 [Perkinsus marinus ATCC 50983]|eukprot:XP_002765928.1 hypothetical protein Pmar_PMAR016881 [Perkinsus marinus ATCC 50983]
MTSSAFELTAIRCDAFEVDTDGAQHTGHRTISREDSETEDDSIACMRMRTLPGGISFGALEAPSRQISGSCDDSPDEQSEVTDNFPEGLHSTRNDSA